MASVQAFGSSPSASTQVALLHQQTAGDRARLDATAAQRLALEEAHVLLALEDLDRAVLVRRRDHHLGEHLGDLLGHLHRHRPVDRDHAAERGDRVALVRLAVRLGDVGTDGDAARVGVLDDRDRGLVEVVRRPAGRVGVDVVVVGHLLAVQLARLREPGRPKPSW